MYALAQGFRFALRQLVEHHLDARIVLKSRLDRRRGSLPVVPFVLVVAGEEQRADRLLFLGSRQRAKDFVDLFVREEAGFDAPQVQSMRAVDAEAITCNTTTGN